MRKKDFDKNRWVTAIVVGVSVIGSLLTVRQSVAHEIIQVADVPLTPEFNNASPETYKALSKLSGDQKAIQS